MTAVETHVHRLNLLLLGALLVLGRDDSSTSLYDLTNISNKVHRVFSHKFVQYGSTVLYDSYIIMPTANEHASVC